MLIIFSFLALIILSPIVLAGDIVVMAIFGETAILKIDGAKHKLKIGDKTPEGIELTQVTSDSVELKINNKKDWHGLGGHVSFGSVDSIPNGELKESIAKIWPRNDMYITRGAINGFSVEFLVDTGATWIAMSEQVARRIGIDFYSGTRANVGTASGVAPVYVVTLKTVQVGQITLRNIKAAVLKNNHSNQVLLGNSFLKRVEMTRKKRVMILKLLEVTGKTKKKKH